MTTLSTPDASAAPDISAFGYRQELRRSLKMRHLIAFGLAYINVMGLFTLYGLVTVKTHGMLALAFIVATGAMVFTALSYGKMAREFPISGSVYTYTQRSFNAHIGFVVGWVVMLDYLILPLLNFLLIGLYLNVLVPGVPIWAWSLVALVVITFLTIRGVTESAATSMITTVLGMGFIAAFVVFLIKYLIGGEGAGTLFSLSGFATVTELTSSQTGIASVLGAAAVLCLMFLGFDGITTFSEESVNPARDMPRAIILTCVIAGAVFIGGGYLAQLAWPDAWSQIINPDTAATELITRAAGPVMTFLFTVIFIAGCIGSGSSGMASGARILYAMGRDGVLPSFLGRVHDKFKTPIVAILFIAAVGIISLFIDLMSVSSIINFGAIIAFFFVNLSVIAHFWVRQHRRSPKETIAYLVLPALGAVISAALWLSLDKMAMIIGCTWTVLGVILLAVQTKGFKQNPVTLTQ
ncbi:MAG: APC family permease [Propionibacteriaceae bacterium]|jgi:amino acid transporter|nr:APC family permease [Propionibacteriaceae bacterium]